MTEDQPADEKLQRRSRVSGGLHSRSERLAGVYVAALREFDSVPPRGGEVARVAIICHCMREIMNGLPLVMAANVVARPKPSSSSLVSKLPDLIAKHSQLDLRAKQDNIPVPAEVGVAIADLVEAAVKESGLNVANAAALLTDGTDTGHPLLGQWKAAQRFFLEWAHLDRNADESRALPNDAEIEGYIRVVEDVIEVRTSLFFENLEAVQDLLALANATEGDVA